LVPPAALRLTMAMADGKGLMAKKAAHQPTVSHQPSAISHRKSASRAQSASASWWTARARTGSVTPGFTKDEILKPAKDDPRAPGGVFELVGGLLSDLIDQR